MTKEEHQNIIDIVKEVKMKPIEVVIMDTADGTYVVPLSTDLSPMKIEGKAKVVSENNNHFVSFG